MVIDIETGSIRRQEPRIVVCVFPVQQDAVPFGDIFPEAGLYKDILVPLPVHMPEYTVHNEPREAAFGLVIGYFCAPFPPVQQAVEAGQLLCVIEAMKMFNEVRADAGGTVQQVLVQSGQEVEAGQPLFRFA